MSMWNTFRKWFTRRRQSPIRIATTKHARPRAELLEDRVVPTARLILDFGAGVGMGNTLSTTVGAFTDVFGPGLATFGSVGTGSDMTLVGMDNADSLDFTPLSYDFNGDAVVNNADITALANAVVPLIQRAMEPFDISVVVNGSASFGAASTFVGGNSGDADGGFDAYCFIMDITSDAFGGGSVGDNATGDAGDRGDGTGLFGIAAADDLFAQQFNQQDEATLTFADSVFSATTGTPGTAQFNQNLAQRIAYTATHEAFHTFTFVHTNSLTASGDVIRVGSVTREDPFIVTRFDLAHDSAVAEPNNYNVLAADPAMGLRDTDNDTVPDLAYVTGTGAHDRITLTNAGGGIVNVLVQAYSNAAKTTLIASETYSINLATDTEGTILIDASINQDEVIIDGSIPATFRVRGGTGLDGVAAEDDRIVVNNYNVSTVTVTHTAPDAGTVAVSGGATIDFSEFEPLTLAGTTDDLIINLPGTNDQAILEDDGIAANGISQIRSQNGTPTFETTSFSNPDISLTVNMGGDSGTLTVGGAAVATFFTDFTRTLNINGQAGVDNVIFQGNVNLSTAGADLTVNVAGTITDNAAASLQVVDVASLTGTGSVTLGDNAADVTNFGTLTFASAGAVSISEDSGTSISGTNTALTLNLVSAGAIADATGASLTVTNNASFSGASITLGDNAADVTNFGRLTFTSSGSVAITEDSATVLTGSNSATALTLISAGSITDEAGTAIAITNNASFNGTSITLGDDVADVLNFLSLTVNSAGAVAITEDSNMAFGGTTNTAGSLTVRSEGAGAGAGNITDGGTADFTVTGLATFLGGNEASDVITIGDSAGNDAFFGSLTFTLPAGAATIVEDDSTLLAGASTAGSLSLTSAGAIDDGAAATVGVTGAAAFNGTAITLDNASNNFGSLTFSSAGVVTIVESSATAFAGLSTGSTITVTSAGAMTDAESDAGDDIDGTALTLTAVGGIGAGAALHIDVASLDVNNAAGANGIFLTNTTGVLLTLTDLPADANSTAVSGFGGGGEIRNGSPLLINADAITTGGMTYTAADSAAAGDDLTIDPGVTVQDTTAGLTFNVGDNLEMDPTSTIDAATGVIINLDAGNADPGIIFGSTTTLDGSILAGTTITVNGDVDQDRLTITSGTNTVDNIGANLTFNSNGGQDTLALNDSGDATGDSVFVSNLGAPGSGNITGLGAATFTYTGFNPGGSLNVQTGDTQADTVQVQPSQNVPIVLNGNNPTSSPGDVLIYDGSGFKSIGQPNSGAITSPGGFFTVLFSSFETVQTTPGNLLDDIVNVGALETLTPNTLPNGIFLQLDATGTYIQILFDGDTTGGASEVIVSQQLASSVNTIRVQGDGDNDTLTIRPNASGQLPQIVGDATAFGGTAHTNAAFTNANAAAYVNSAGNKNIGIHFDGGAGVNSLAFIFGASENVAHFSDDVAAANSGVVSVAGDFNMSFANVAPITFAGAGGTHLADASANASVTNLSVVDDATPGDGVYEVNANGTFEDETVSGFATLIVRSGPGGDTINVVGVDGAVPAGPAGAAALTSLTLDGDNIGNTDVSADILNIESLPATVTATMFGGDGDDEFFLGGSTFRADLVLGQVTVSPAGDEGGDDLLSIIRLFAPTGSTTLVTSTVIDGLTGAAAPAVTYNAGDLIETVQLLGSEFDSDTFNVQSTMTGSTYFIVTGFAAVADTVNIGSAAPALATSVLDDIDGQVNVQTSGGADSLNISDQGDTAADTYSLSLVGGITELTFGDGAAAVDIRYNLDLSSNATAPDLENFLLIGSAIGDNTYNINNTTGTVSNRVDDGDAVGSGDGLFNITGDGLSANNAFNGFDGNDQFNLTINGNIGDDAVAGGTIASVLIDGGAGVGGAANDTDNRDRTTITDNAATARDLNYQYLTSQGGLDIEANSANNGLFGANGGGSLALNIRTMETLIFNGDAGNDDLVQVSGTINSEIITVALVPTVAGVSNADSSALVFLGGNPYLSAPGANGGQPASLDQNLPGFAGGGTGVDMLLNGIDPAGITLFGGGIPLGGGDRAVVQAASENDLTTGTLDVFGFGAGVLQPGFGAGNAYDTIDVSDAQVTTANNGQGDLVTVNLFTASFIQGTPASSTQQPALIVNGGDEAAAQANGIADDFTATPSADFNIQINGNLPDPATFDVDGLPEGDQLAVSGVGAVNLSSDKVGNVTTTFGNSTFGVKSSSIERLSLTPTNGVVNLIGDNNDPTVDQPDNFVVLGRDIDAGGSTDGGVGEFSLVLNGSAPILLNDVQSLNVFGYDLVGQNLNNPDPNAPDGGAGGIDTLDITPWADNSPRGWGIHVNYNEGEPDTDGAQLDLLIYNTVSANPVSENIVIQPSGPEDGEVRVTNGADGSAIVTISYINNLDIIVDDNDGFASDTDTLTLRGTNPDNPNTSGDERFIADFTNAGTVAEPMVVVQDFDGVTLGPDLYRLRSFSNFDSINLHGLDGRDMFRIVGRDDGSLNINVDGGGNFNFIELDATTGNDQYSISALNEAADGGLLVVRNNAAPNTTQINFQHIVQMVSQVFNLHTASGDGGQFDTLDLHGPTNSDFFELNASANDDGGRAELNGLDFSFFDFATPGNGSVRLFGAEGADVFRLNHAQGWEVGNVQVSTGTPELASVQMFGSSVDDLFAYTATSLVSGTVRVTAPDPGGPTTVYTLFTGSLSIDGRTPATANADALTVTTVNAIITPGAAPGTGTVSPVNAAASPLLPLTYTGIETATVTGTTAVITGTSENDTIAVAANGDVTVTNTLGFSNTFNVAGYNALVINALGGDDSITIDSGALFAGGVTVIGGEPGLGSDVLNLTGQVGTVESVTIDSGLNGLATSVSGLGSPITVNGVELVTYTGQGGDDNLNVLPGGGTETIRVAQSGDDLLPGLVTINGAARVQFRGLDTFRVSGSSLATQTLVFALPFLAGATNFEAQTFSPEDALVIEGSDSGADNITVTNPVAGQIAITDGAVTVTETVGSRLTVLGLGGDDTLTVDISVDGLIGQAISFDGGAGSDALFVAGTLASGTLDTVEYTPGPAAGAGSLNYAATGGAVDSMSIEFNNLEPVIDTTTATTLIVNGTNAANAINYTQGPNSGSAIVGGAVSGLVSVDSFETIEFANKTTLTINALAGSDEISLNNPTTPTGLTGITVNGGDPTASDTLIVNGTAATVSVNTAAQTITGAGPVTINYGADVEHLTVVDSAATTTLAVNGSSDYTVNPAAAADGGAILTDAIPIDFVGFGDGEFINLNAGGTLVVNGTAGNDIFTVSATEEITITGRATIVPTGVADLVLNGLAGDDTFTIPGGLSQFDTVTVNGGEPSASDVLFLTGEAGAVETVTIAPDAINPTEQDIDGFGPAPINVSGVELIRYTGSGGNDVLTVDLGGTDGAARVQAIAPATDRVTSDVLPNIDFSGLNTFVMDTVGGTQTVTFKTANLGGAGPFNYQFEAGPTDTLIIEGADAQADDYIVENPLGPQSVSLFDTVFGIIVAETTGNLNRLQINTLGGDDIVTVRLSAGDGETSVPITFDGGLGRDTLIVTGTPPDGDIFDSVTYTPGPAVGQGRLQYTAPAMLIDFLNLEPVIDTAPATALIVNGTNADNAINYSQGSVAANGLVSVDGFETIEFSNKTTLTINALAGSDIINLNNPSAPTSLTGITVNGGDPTGSDTVIVNGTTAQNNVNVTPTGANAATISGVGPTITVATTEHLTYNGQLGNDNLTYTTPAGPDEVVLDDGPLADIGTISTRRFNGNQLLGVSFSQLGFTGTVNFADAGGLRSDELVINASDPAATNVVIGVDAAGVITTVSPIAPGNTTELVNVTTPGVNALRLNTFDGDDVINVVGNHPFDGGIFVFAGDPSASDVLNFTGTGGLITVETDLQTVTQAGSAAVANSGIEHVNVNAANNAVDINGSADDDAFTVRPNDATGAEVTLAGVNTVFQVNDTLDLEIDGDDGPGLFNSVTVIATENDDTIGVTGTVVSIAGRLPVNLSDIRRLAVEGQDGSDTFNVTQSADVSIFIDGGDPIGSLPGDVLNLIPTDDPTFTPGPENDEGGFSAAGGLPVSFDHIETISVDLSGVGGTATVTGTGGNDHITIVGTAANTVDVQVNNGPIITYAGITTLTVEAGNGNDDVTLDVNVAALGVTFAIDGGLPTASDTLRVTGVDGVNDTPVWTPNSSDGGTLQLAGQSPINVTFTEHLIYDGESDNETLTIVATAGPDTITHTPGVNNDAGNLRVNSLLAINYEDLGASGSLTVNAGAAGGGRDTLVAVGTGSNDTFTVATTTGAVTLNARPVINQISVEDLTLDGLNGDDTFAIPGGHPFTNINVQGGDPSASDVLFLTGTPGVVADTVTIQLASGNPTAQEVLGLGAVLGNIIHVNGTELIQYTGVGGGDTLIVNPGTGNNQVRVSGSNSAGPINTVGDTVTSDSLPEIRFFDLNTFRADILSGLDTITFVTRFLTEALRYEALTSTTDSLVIEGSDGASADNYLVTNPGGADYVRVTDNNNGVSINGTGIGIARLQINTLGGDDNVTLNVGTPGGPIAAPITYDGGLGSDTLFVLGTPPGPDPFDSVTYTPGPAVDQGRLTYVDGGSTEMLIDFRNLEPVIDLVPSAELTVNGTNADNAFTYTGHPVGRGTNTGVVAVDGFETIEFANKIALNLNGLGGNDTFSLNNPTVPGAGANSLTTINVDGGGPTASDTVIVNGTTDDDTVTIDTLTSAGARVTGLGATVNIATVEHLLYNGLGGNDSLTYSAPAGSNLTYTPGAAPDAGFIDGSLNTQLVTIGGGSGTFTLTFNGQTTGALPFNATASQVQTALNALPSIGGVGGSASVTLAAGAYTIAFGGSLAGTNSQVVAIPAGGATSTVASNGSPYLPVAFVQLGNGGQSVNIAAAAGVDSSLVVNGTNASDSFGVSGNQVTLATKLPLLTSTSITTLTLDGLAGDDTFTVVGNHPYSAGVLVNGGEPSASDVLNFTGSGADSVAVDLGAQTVTEAGFGAVAYSGIETLNVDANNTLSLTATASDDSMTVTVYSATSGQVKDGISLVRVGEPPQQAQAPVIYYSNITGALEVDLGDGEDRLAVVGSALSQTFNINASANPFLFTGYGAATPASTVEVDDGNDFTLDGAVTYSNTEALQVGGLEGDDTFNVLAGTIPVFVDGGDPIGSIPGLLEGDLIVPFADGNPILPLPGPEVDEGGFIIGDEQRVSYDHIEGIIIVGADCALIIGTNADDDITIIARDQSYITPPPVLDGVQDFTTVVNNQMQILWVNTPEIHVDALAGDDDVVLRTPAPNNAVWDVEVHAAGGTPAAPTGDQGDVFELETPFQQSVTFTPTGVDSAEIEVETLGGGHIATIILGTFTDACPPINYDSSEGGFEQVVYQGLASDDELTINGTDGDDTTIVNVTGAGSGSFRSDFSPTFDFTGATAVSVNGGGGGFDQVTLLGSAGADVVTSTADEITLGGTLTIGTDMDRLIVSTLAGNDNIDLDLNVTDLEKVVDAGIGNDTVNMADAVDATIIGGAGNDLLTGSPERDDIDGGAGNDIIFGLGAEDILHGGEGNDMIVGGTGDDQAYGAAGSDTFVWNPGDGDDLFEGDEGDDTLAFAGTNGTDTYTIFSDNGRVIFQRQPGNVGVNMGGVENIIANSETIQLSGRNEVPANTTTSSGFANFSYNAATGTFDVRIFVLGITQANLLDSHIHMNIPGSNGPVVVGFGGGANYVPTSGGLLFTDTGLTLADITTANTPGFTAQEVLMEILLGRAYFNVHSVAFPGGEIRGNIIAPSGPTAGSGGGDSLEVRDTTNTSLRNITFDAGNEAEILNGAALVDTVIVQGLGSRDEITASVPNVLDNNYLVTGLPYRILINGSDGTAAVATLRDQFTLNGNGGDDVLKAQAPIENITRVTLDGGAGDDNLSADAILIGGPGDDFLEGGAGDDLFFGNEGEDVMIGNAGADTFDGGADFDTILVRGASSNDVISVNQTAATTLVHTVNGNTQTDTLITVGGVRTVEAVRVEAGAGADVINTTWADSLGQTPTLDSLRIDVVGGPDFTQDRLGIVDGGTGDLILLRHGAVPSTGTVTIGPGNPEPLQLTYQEIERVDPIAGQGGQIVTFHSDPHEFNDNRQNAGQLARVGQSSTSPNIEPGSDPNFGLPADQDWYEFRPQSTNTFNVTILFDLLPSVPSGRLGLPGNGDLSLEIRDANGNLIVTGTPFVGGSSATFAATNDPAFPQFNRIFVRVQGGGATAINRYDFDNLAGAGSGNPGVSIVDVFGPQVIGVSFPADPGINIFVPKPTLGPSPLVQSLQIDLVDRPDRAPGLPYPAIEPSLFVPDPTTGAVPAMGLFSLVGDRVGNVPILDVVLTNDPVTVGAFATANVVIVFDINNPNYSGGLPDDRYTLTINDGLIDPAGNELDGESNAAQPNAVPAFPSGNGQPGGNFVARFTVNSRPHLGTYGNGSQYLDINGNAVWDPNNPDAVNADKTFTLGRYTDTIFAGDFAPAGGAGNGFDKLGAYGVINGSYRFLLATGGVVDNVLTITPTYQINGRPLAYRFNPAIDADQIAIFDGNGKWYIDFGHQNNIGGSGTIVVNDGLRGYPVVGDFDGSGTFDLATYQPDTDTWQFDLHPLTSPGVHATLSFGSPGVMERPVADDMNHDGITDIGLFIPTSSVSSNNTGADWKFLESPGPAAPILAGFVPGPTSPFLNTIGAIAHPFNPAPFSQDQMYHFGNGFLQPIVGVWDPPAPTPPPVLKLAPGTFTDVSVSALVDIVPAGGAVGLVARRAANGSSQYYGGISRTANGYTALIRLYRNGVWSTLASTPIASLSGRNTLKLDVIGTTLELSLNGNLLLSTPSGALKLAGATGTYSDVGGMIWPAAATSVSRPLAALPFTDGFAQADGTLLDRIAWNEWAGSFQAQNQVAIGQNSANLATLHSAAQPDVAQSVDVVHLPSGGSAGLLARYNVATDSFYRANLTATFSAKTNTTTYSAQIWRKQGAIWTRLASKTVSGTGTLTFVTVGGSQQLFLNGVLVASANDKMLLTGAYGIYASKGAGLDNYSAQSQALTIPALPFSDSFSAAGPALGVNWSPNAGVFSATGSQIVGGAAANIATLYKSVQTDSVQSVDVVSFAAGGFAGLVARSDASAGNLYRAGLTSVYNAATRTTTYFAQIWRKQGATWIKLASSAVGSGAGTLTFATVGASQQLFLNGVLVAASADTVLKTGTIGVFATQGATLDNFAANKPVFTVTGLPFSDSFTTGTTPGSNWYANAGAFTVTGNKLVGKTANNMLTLFGASKLDVSVQADISGLAGGVSAGVLARYNAVNGNTYWAGLVASHNASTGVTTYTAQIKRRVNGVWTVLFSKAAGTQAGLVRFEVTGSQLSLSLNGTLVGSVRDTVLSTAGTVGVSGGNGAQFGGFLAS